MELGNLINIVSEIWPVLLILWSGFLKLLSIFLMPAVVFYGIRVANRKFSDYTIKQAYVEANRIYENWIKIFRYLCKDNINSENIIECGCLLEENRKSLLYFKCNDKLMNSDIDECEKFNNEFEEHIGICSFSYKDIENLKGIYDSEYKEIKKLKSDFILLLEKSKEFREKLYRSIS